MKSNKSRRAAGRFRFKQFTIHQDRTAMKVCTDACVLGAYADVGDGGRLLDIGTGTGLLGLMAAQRNTSAQIDAVEMDEEAFGQATENARSSPFSERVTVVKSRIQDFPGNRMYDRILTNPPFYTNHLHSPDAAINRALHTDELPFKELIEAVVRLIKTDGQWWVLLPPYEAGKLEEFAGRKGLKPFNRLALRHHTQKPIFRVITGFSFDNRTFYEETLSIYEFAGQGSPNNEYTLAFQALLKEFYLIF